MDRPLSQAVRSPSDRPSTPRTRACGRADVLLSIQSPRFSKHAGSQILHARDIGNRRDRVKSKHCISTDIYTCTVRRTLIMAFFLARPSSSSSSSSTELLLRVRPMSWYGCPLPSSSHLLPKELTTGRVRFNDAKETKVLFHDGVTLSMPIPPLPYSSRLFSEHVDCMEEGIYRMIDEEAKTNMELSPSTANIVSVVYEPLAVALSSPVLACSSQWIRCMHYAISFA
jgi:hypothetical protein